jgi:uncharacterized protein with HEPN domain
LPNSNVHWNKSLEIYFKIHAINKYTTFWKYAAFLILQFKQHALIFKILLFTVKNITHFFHKTHVKVKYPLWSGTFYVLNKTILESVGLTATATKYTYITPCTDKVHIFNFPLTTTGEIVQNFVSIFGIIGYEFVNYCTVWTKLKFCVFSCNIIPIYSYLKYVSVQISQTSKAKTIAVSNMWSQSPKWW